MKERYLSPHTCTPHTLRVLWVGCEWCVPRVQLAQQQEEVCSLQGSHSQAEADIEVLKKDISAREDALRRIMSALHGLVTKVMGMLLRH